MEEPKKPGRPRKNGPLIVKTRDMRPKGEDYHRPGPGNAMHITDEDRKKVRKLAKYLRRKDMAYIMGMSITSFDRHFHHEAKMGRMDADKRVVRATYEMAVEKKHPQINKLWVENRLGWGKVDQSQLEDELNNDQKLDISKLNEDQLRTLAELHAIMRPDTAADNEREMSEEPERFY